VQYVLRTRSQIQPVGWAGHTRLFKEDDLPVIAAALKKSSRRAAASSSSATARILNPAASRPSEIDDALATQDFQSRVAGKRSA
jgi:hypothetical protein